MSSPGHSPYNPPAHPAQAPKKSGGGCMIALLVLGTVVFAGAGLAALGVYLFATSKGGKEVIQVVGQGVKAGSEALKVMEAAAQAPGAPELRALGCRPALVIDMADMLRALDQFDAGLAAKAPSGVALMITCQVGVLDKPPACDDAARTYVGAVGRAAGEFSVLVTVERRQGSQCSSRYAADGTHLGAFHGAPPTVPGATAP